MSTFPNEICPEAGFKIFLSADRQILMCHLRATFEVELSTARAEAPLTAPGAAGGSGASPRAAWLGTRRKIPLTEEDGLGFRSEKGVATERQLQQSSFCTAFQAGVRTHTHAEPCLGQSGADSLWHVPTFSAFAFSSLLVKSSIFCF